MPFLFRSALPFRALSPVLLWLYVWRMLNPTKPFRPIQFLHLLIPTIIIIGLSPEFLKPVAYKIEMLSTFYMHNNYLMLRKTGIFPAGFIQPFLLVFGLIYIFISILYIWRFQKTKSQQYKETNKLLLRWILLVASVIAVFVLLQSVQYLSLLFKGDFSFFAQIGQSLSLIYLKAYLLVNPSVIENMDGCLDVIDEMPNSSVNIDNILPRVSEDFQNSSIYIQVNHFLVTNEGYKDPNLSLESMAEKLSISKSKLSSFLQESFGLNFPELINRYRIQHFITLYKADELKQLKVETLILQSGYRNKTTFYLAFKKVLQTNPSTFMKQSQLS
jgi:AraC-like DNA-binding protein